MKWQISSLHLPPDHEEKDLRELIFREGLYPTPEEITMIKKSLDARKKSQIHYLYTVGIDEKAKRAGKLGKRVGFYEEKIYCPPNQGEQRLNTRPIVIGAGPAGLFAALLLAESGYRPLIIERGAPVEERTKDVMAFWQGGPLNPESNVQFGEGGAGTFSDGKLNTQVKDTHGRIHKVLGDLVLAGADSSIMYWHKPHIGTDVLQEVVKNLRLRIQQEGGEFCFHTRLEDLVIREGKLVSIKVKKFNQEEEEIPAEAVILAIGHSARDTFSLLQKRNVPMHAKSFAVGVRVEHPQEMINEAQYGDPYARNLPVADYKLTAQTTGGRGVYSFCMCPGGKVVNASSQVGHLAVNGMSYSQREGRNANSALIVTVTPQDYPGEDALAGVAFQQELERLAFREGEGNIPVQAWGDFEKNRITSSIQGVIPDLMGAYTPGNLRRVLPEQVSLALMEGMRQFGRKIPGFDREDAMFSGVESRTSSPVRLERNLHLESEVGGLFPCGEGAGYAGGITSAAVDGLKVAEEIIRRYRPWT